VESAFAGSGAEPFRAALRGIEAGQVGQSVGRILAVDPGVITGVSALYFSLTHEDFRPVAWAETLITHDEIQQVHDLLSFVDTMQGGPVDVVLEDFRVGRVAMEKTFLSPVRIGRRYEWGLLTGQWFWPVRIYWHFNTDMATWDDERLKNVGFYTPGPDHRRDATRHVLQHHRQIRTGKITSWSRIPEEGRWEPQPRNRTPGVRISPMSAGAESSSKGVKKVQLRKRKR